MGLARQFALVLGLMAAAACGSGGGGDEGAPGPGLPPNLTGWWMESFDDMDAPVGYRPFQLLPLVDDGATVLYDGWSLRKEGVTLNQERPSADDPDRQVWRLHIVNARRIEGTTEKFAGGVRDWADHRLLTATTPPDGTLVMNGRIAGHDVAVDTSVAYAFEQDSGSTQTSLWIREPDPGSSTHLLLTYDARPHIPVGTYEVGFGDGEIQFSARTQSWYGATGSGNVVLTESSDTRVAGWYIVSFSDGSPLSGSFDVPVRISWP